MLLKGKTVLVTGTASGIGRETALHAVREGATHVACLDIADEPNAATAELLHGMGAQARAIHVDLGDVASIRAAYAEAMQLLTHLDGAAHIGGYSWRGETLDVTEEQWDAVINANLRSTFFLCQEALRVMYPRATGAIVNTSADAAFHPIAGMAVQAAGKGAIVPMTRTMALEAAPRGVRVNVVSPGIVRTQRAGAERPSEPPLRRDIPAAQAAPTPDPTDHLAAQTAAGRYMTMAEVAQTNVFLLSDAASGINGELLAVNGGGYLSLRY
ncbi:SDR family NAD(P)-dependent oxidoreductase [Sphingomonas profundi]|uniref:SDR family NAD(P)-dependent oxidoreductase n=1 Tax=Alterirhizorhabdus profundi TaxID=2681549 RepID=UPI0018D0C285|nr:SDR family NAD(P)-dependent oxidoreductase [Sphingomonas profundi]